MRLNVKLPCCQQAAHVEAMRNATVVVRRTCSDCDRTWQLVVKPLGVMLGGVAHELIWAEVSK